MTFQRLLRVVMLRMGAIVLLLMVMALGCAHRPSAALDAARRAYADAAADPQVVQYAPVQLRDARMAVDRAKDEWSDDGDTDETSHLAYVAARRVEIAREVARREAARNVPTTIVR